MVWPSCGTRLRLVVRSGAVTHLKLVGQPVCCPSIGLMVCPRVAACLMFMGQPCSGACAEFMVWPCAFQWCLGPVFLTRRPLGISRSLGCLRGLWRWRQLGLSRARRRPVWRQWAAWWSSRRCSWAVVPTLGRVRPGARRGRWRGMV